MTRSAERLSTQTPGRLESRCATRERAQLSCVLQQLHREDLEPIICGAMTDEDIGLEARADQESFRLHVQFVRAHGLPKGETTLLSTGPAFHSGVDLRR